MKPTAREQAWAQTLSGISNDRRLQIFRLLVRAGAKGASVGAIQEKTGIPASSLNHHLASLVSAGLVLQTKNGRTILCRADFDRMSKLIEYLTENCCQGLD